MYKDILYWPVAKPYAAPGETYVLGSAEVEVPPDQASTALAGMSALQSEKIALSRFASG